MRRARGDSVEVRDACESGEGRSLSFLVACLISSLGFDLLFPCTQLCDPVLLPVRWLHGDPVIPLGFLFIFLFFMSLMLSSMIQCGMVWF